MPSFNEIAYDASLPGAPAPGSVPLCVTIITREEAANIEACIHSCAFAAQIVVVDAMSEDETVELAAALGADVFRRAWPGYTEQRNFSIRQSRYDWIFSLDADERVSMELAKELSNIMTGSRSFDAYKIPEWNNYFGRWLSHGGIYPGYHISLFDRRKGIYQSGMADVHEDVHFKVTGLLQGHIIHYAYLSFDLAIKKLNRYTELEARGRHAKGQHSGYYGIFWRPLERFFKNYIFKAGFLDGWQGFLYCFLCSFYAFVTGVKMLEMERMEHQGQVLKFPRPKGLPNEERSVERMER